MRRWLAPLFVCMLFACPTLAALAQASSAPTTHANNTQVVVGSKNFTESVVLGEIAAYPEYTGTLTHELLHGVPPNAGIDVLRARLKPLSIGITDPLGFNNT